MSSKLSLLALGLGVYLAVAVVSFPASLAYRWFAPHALTLAVVEGTIWNGAAAHGAVGGIAFSNLEWQLHPAALLTGTLSLTAETDLAGGFARAQVSASGNRVELSDVSAGTSLQTFAGLLPLGDVRGEVSLSLQRLELVDGWPMSAAGEIRIGGLAVPPLIPMAGITTIPLGNYRAQFTPGETAGIVALLSDQGGPLELTGQLTLAPDHSYVLDTLLKPRADAPSVLVEGIDMVMQPPNADGQRKFTLSGSL